jgi:hypothetical protein
VVAPAAARARDRVTLSHLWPSFDCPRMRVGLLPLLHCRSSPERRPGRPEPRSGHPPLFPGVQRKGTAILSLSIFPCVSDMWVQPASRPRMSVKEMAVLGVLSGVPSKFS